MAIELGRVEGVEGQGAELDVDAFGGFEILVEREIRVGVAGPLAGDGARLIAIRKLRV